MAGLTPQPAPQSGAPNPPTSTAASASLAALSSSQFFRTIAWLRWRTFANSLRGKGAMGELAVSILSYFVLALIVIGPSFGAGFAAWYLVSHHLELFLAIPLWIIFFLWQVVGASTSAAGPAFSLDSLIRFPIRYRDYLLMRLTFGLMDPPTLAGFGCLFAMTLGAAIAAPTLAPWAALALVTYALCNLFFSRMIYTWLERWLAQRRTRELVTALILVGSIGIQFVSQFINRFTGVEHHAPPSPLTLAIGHALITANWFLPPGLAASSIARINAVSPALAVLSYVGLLAYTAVFLYVLHLRLHAQFRGENLSEAPAAATSTSTKPKRLIPRSASHETHSRAAFPSPQIAALFRKELHMLLRSGPRLYALVMPVFIVYLFSFRSAGLAQAGFADTKFTHYLFSYGCAYTLFVFTNLIYNALGNEGAGVQFYFLAPMRIQDVLLAKNLLLAILFAIEIVLIYAATLTLHIHTPAALAATTIAWTAFTLLVHLSIGNVRSLVAPKGVDPAKVRRQNVSAVSSFISMGLTLVAGALGQLLNLLCTSLHLSLWYAAALFLILAILAFGMYILVLKRCDSIAANHREDLARELGKF